MNGKTRIVVNFQSQISSELKGDALNYSSASVDSKMKIGNNFIGYGLSLSKETTALTTPHDFLYGPIKFNRTRLNASLSFIKKIDGSGENSHYFCIGQNIGIVQPRLDLANAFDPVPDISPPASLTPDFLHLDLTTGVIWSSQLKGHNSFNFGLAIHHLNKPNVSFYGNTPASLHPRLSVHASGEISLSNSFSMTPVILYDSQAKSDAFQAGTGFRLYFLETTKFSFIDIGLQGRFGNTGWQTILNEDTFMINGFDNNAIIATIRAVLNKLSIGLSFEFKTDEMIHPSQKGRVLEISFGYLLGQTVTLFPTY